MPTYRRNIHIGGEKKNLLQEREDYNELLDRLKKQGGNIIPLSYIGNSRYLDLRDNNVGTIGTYLYLELGTEGRNYLLYKSGEAEDLNGDIHAVYERREFSDKDLYIDIENNAICRYVRYSLQPVLPPDKSLGMEKLNFTPICEVDTRVIKDSRPSVSQQIKPTNGGVLNYDNEYSDVKLVYVESNSTGSPAVVASVNELSNEDIDEIISSTNPEPPKATAKAAAKPSNNNKKIEIINL